MRLEESIFLTTSLEKSNVCVYSHTKGVKGLCFVDSLLVFSLRKLCLCTWSQGTKKRNDDGFIFVVDCVKRKESIITSYKGMW